MVSTYRVRGFNGDKAEEEVKRRRFDQTADHSTPPLAIKLREAPLRMIAFTFIHIYFAEYVDVIFTEFLYVCDFMKYLYVDMT
jgi:hypothetical protein